MDKRTGPSANESEAGIPHTSRYGMEFRAGAMSLINDAQYLPGPFTFREFYGNAGQRGAKVVPITHISGYQGDVSLKYQPEIKKKAGFAQ